jgi:hypothetical protein
MLAATAKENPAIFVAVCKLPLVLNALYKLVAFHQKH